MSDSAQILATAFLALLNGVALLLIVLEYRRTGNDRSRFAALSQGLVLAWHGMVIFLTFMPGNAFLLAFSAASIFLAVFSSIVTVSSSVRLSIAGRRFGSAALLALLLIGVGGAFVPWIPMVAWLLTALMLIALPVLTIMGSRLHSRWVLGLLQLVIALCFIGGIAILSQGEAENGALLYFMMLVLVPATTLIFMQGSMQSSAQKLQAWERQLENLYDSVGETFFELDAQSRIVRMSSSVQQFGYQRHRLLGTVFTELFDDVGGLFDPLRNEHGSSMKNIPARLVDADGEKVECEISATIDAESEGANIIGSIRNVEEKKRFEKQLYESQRRESLGRLAAGVAHDFNNVLQSIVSHAQLGLYSSRDDQVSNRLRAIVDSSKVAGSICEQLLQYTGDSFSKSDNVDLDKAVRDVLQMLMPSIPAGVELKYETSSGGSNVTGDATQLQQVIMNLLQNAVDATTDGIVRISISRANTSPDTAPDYIAGVPISEDLDYVALEISDTGTGILVENISKIFDPFYTTREEGNGLGLSAVAGILESHAGRLNVWTDSGQGTTMQILLPTSQTSPVREDALAGHQSMKRGDTILYAEDNDDVRHATEALLSNLGFKVVSVRNGHEAVDAFSQLKNDVALFVSDIRMPLKDGIEAAREICKEREVPVLLASGYSEFASKLTAEENRHFKFIQKPFTLDTLRVALDETLALSP